MPPAVMDCTSDFYPGMKSNAADEIKYVDRYVDAGASSTTGGSMPAGIPAATAGRTSARGNPTRALSQGAPGGRRPRSRQGHEAGRVVRAGTGRGRHVAGRASSGVGAGRQGRRLLDLGNPQARDWLTEHVDKLISEQGIDLYRQDFNMEPLGYWRDNDPPDRQGITEIRHVRGYLAYWDELRRRHPANADRHLRQRRAAQRSGNAPPRLSRFAERLPLRAGRHARAHLRHGALDPLLRHGRVCRQRLRRPQPLVPVAGDRPARARGKGQDWAQYHGMVAELRQVTDYFSGDYYPLTRYSLDNAVWMAWQFDRPEIGEGVVQVFCRADSPYESATFPPPRAGNRRPIRRQRHRLRQDPRDDRRRADRIGPEGDRGKAAARGRAVVPKGRQWSSNPTAAQVMKRTDGRIRIDFFEDPFHGSGTRFALHSPAQQALVEENRLVAVFGDPANRPIDALGMVGNVVEIKRPEILFVREEVHDLRGVGILGQRLQIRGDAFQRHAVADDADA